MSPPSSRRSGCQQQASITLRCRHLVFIRRTWHTQHAMYTHPSSHARLLPSALPPRLPQGLPKLHRACEGWEAALCGRRHA